MADHRNWKSRALRAGGIAALALGLGLMLAVWGSTGALAVTAEDPTPAPAPAAAPSHGDKDGNRIADGLEKKMQGLGADAVLRVIVTMAKGKGVAAATAAAGSFTVLRRFTIINGFTATMTRAQIEALAKSPGVVSIYDDIEVKANRADAMQAFGVTQVHTNPLAELTITYKGTGVGICIVDTGIFAGHSEFSVGGVSKIQGFCDATNGGCFAGDVGVPAYDDNGHGTHVASIAAGNFGVAPKAKLYGAKVLNAVGSGSESDVIAGFDWCAAQPGVQVINASLTAAGSSDGADPMSNAASNAAALKVVVLAAGNTGPGQLQIGAPAAAEAPITVGAVADWKSPVGGWRKGLAVFSGRGPTADDRIKPDILAPGVDIEAAWNDGGTFVASGTSMASPFVAGVAALMLDADSGLSPAAVKGIIRDTSVTRGDRSFLDAAGRPKNYDYGWGELDAYAAVAEADGASTYTPTLFPVELYQNPTIADGASWDYEFVVTDPNTQISANVYNGGQWITMYFPGFGWLRLSRGQDFDVQLYAPQGPQGGPPGGTLVDESTCEIDGDTACGISSVPALWGRQETLVADPADFPGGLLPLGTWRLHVEAWGDTDGISQEIIDAVITLGPLGGGVLPPGNDPPVADAQGVGTAEDTVKAITLTASDPDGDGLTFSIVSGPSNGILSGTAPNLTYTPNGNYNGADSFTFKANDGTVDSNSALVSITVNAVNDAPVADAQGVGTAEDTAVLVTLTASDVDGDTLSLSVDSFPAHGALSGVIPNLIYTPNGGYNGADSFTFKANDGTIDSNSALVSITVTAANDAPVADAQGVGTAEDTAKAITLTASDPDGDGLTYSVVAGPSNGSLSGTAPNLTYTPNANYNGSDSFTFKANDGTVDSNTATVSITVNAVNDPPVADAQGVSTDEDTAKAITLTASDLDPDTLTYSVVAGPSSGILSGTAPNLTYTPNANYNGADSFTFKANDGTVDSNTATVSITVNAAAPAVTGDFTWDAAEAVIDNPFTLSAVFTSATSYGWNLINWPGGPKHIPTLNPVGNGAMATLSAVKAGDVVVALTVGDGVTNATVTKTITIGSAPPPPATFGSVSGTVSGASGNIAGATVTVDTGESTTADVNGDYMLTNVPTGGRMITASAAGYVNDSQAVTVSDSATSTLDFALADVPAGGAVTVSLTPSSTSQGRNWTATVDVNVSDGDGLVTGAVVNGTWSDGTPGDCTTDASGDCPVSLSGIAKKTASLTYIVNAVNGVVSGASVVVFKP